MSDPVHLFVYGTLRVAAQHPMGNLLRSHASLIGSGWMQARLYIVDDPDEPGQNSYPAALPSGNRDDRVHGELYRLTAPNTVLPQFDDYEACSPRWPEPHEFLRRAVTVTLQDGSEHQAVSYLYTWDVTTAQHIASGDYRRVSPDVR